MNNVCEVYWDAMTVRTCMLWFKILKMGIVTYPTSLAPAITMGLFTEITMNDIPPHRRDGILFSNIF